MLDLPGLEIETQRPSWLGSIADRVTVPERERVLCEHVNRVLSELRDPDPAPTQHQVLFHSFDGTADPRCYAGSA